MTMNHIIETPDGGASAQVHIGRETKNTLETFCAQQKLKHTTVTACAVEPYIVWARENIPERLRNSDKRVQRDARGLDAKVYVPAATLEAARKLANAAGIPLAEFVDAALSEYLDRHARTPEWTIERSAVVCRTALEQLQSKQWASA